MTKNRLATTFFAVGIAACALSQDRLPHMPRYERFNKLRNEIYGSVSGGSLRVEWAPDSKSFFYSQNGKNYRYDLASGQASEAPDHKEVTAPPRRQRGSPERGRQFSTAMSFDGKMKAVCKDRNVFIGAASGDDLTQITTEGSVPNRIKCGVASWVYGEELGQREAMWWSPDGKRLAYYRFDEKQTPDYFVPLSETDIQNKVDTEAYPKAGAPNPIAEIIVYDLDTKSFTKLDTHFKDGGDADLGHYVFNVRWSDDGKSVLFFRSNRKQNALQLIAADPSTGTCRALASESNPTGWAEYSSSILYTDSNGAMDLGGGRFLWISDRSGYRNLYLYEMTGKLIRAVTGNEFDLEAIVKVDKEHSAIWYTAHDGDLPYKLQLHRVTFTGDDSRLTERKWSHTTQVSPDGSAFVDVAQSLTSFPETRVCSADGKILGVVAQSNSTKFEQLGLRKAERIKFKAADGVTDLYGYITFPSDFDPSKKYPLLVNVYAGPESGTRVERFEFPDPMTEFGFVVAWFDGRGTGGRGREFKECVYRKLGIIEIDDQAAGASFLSKRPYIDPAHIGIQGTSYGGYASLMALVRYPDIFKAACASSPVTDWRNYDSIYTERYMDIPSANAAGYDAGSTMTYAKNLKGNLLLYYGTADNNVHPSNTIQMVQALNREGKYFEMTVGPDIGHSQINTARMWEFLVEHLILGK